jgi:hypothetical protein
MDPRSAGDLSLVTRFEVACQEKPYKKSPQGDFIREV